MLKILLGIAVGAWVFAGDQWAARALCVALVFGVCKLAIWAGR